MERLTAARVSLHCMRYCRAVGASCNGAFTMQGSALQTVMVYANSKNTEIRAQLKLRSTTQGANNRLDIQSIVSFDKADGISTPVMGMPFPHDYTVCFC